MVLVPLSDKSPLGSLNLDFIVEALGNKIRGVESDCPNDFIGDRLKHLYSVTSSYRSITIIAENTRGKIEFKIARLLEPSYEDKVLKFLNEKTPGLVPRFYCRASIGDYPIILVMEHLEGEPVTTKYLEAAVDTMDSGDIVKVAESSEIGRAAALLHNVMLSCTQEWCRPDRSSWSSFNSWIQRLEARSVILRKQAKEYPNEVILITEASDALEELVIKLREDEPALIGRPLIRIHGDMHLYQFIITGNRLVLTDFEGEPFKTPASPLEKEPPERDLASLARSLDYAAVMAVMYSKKIDAEEASYNLPNVIGAWEVENFNSIMESYLSQVSQEAVEPLEGFRRSLLFWIVERASYEAVYEMKAGTGLHHIPLNALLRINEGKDPIYEWLRED